MATAAGFSPISFRIQGLGVFPGISRPRVLWAGLTGETDRIAECQQRLDTHLAASGLPKEKRPFRGHLTLGRVKGRIPADRLLQAIKRLSTCESEPVAVDRIVLFQSELKPTGAVYTSLRTVPFNGHRKGRL